MESETHHQPNKNTTKPKTLRTKGCSQQQITCLAVNNNLLYAASINEVNVFDVTDPDCVSHTDMFNNDHTSGSTKSIAFHTDPDTNTTRVFTAHQDCKIRVWQVIKETRRHRLVSTLPTVKDRLLHVMAPRSYVSVRRHEKRLWIEHWDAVSGLAVHGGLMYSVSWDKSFKTWDIYKGVGHNNNYRCSSSVIAHGDAVNTLAVSSEGTVYTGSADGSIKVWNRVNNDKKNKRQRFSCSCTVARHKSTVNALALAGSVLVSGSGDGSIMVWERQNGGVLSIERDRIVFVEELRGHGGAVLCLISVGDTFVSGSSDRTVRIWQRNKIDGSCCAMVLEGHDSPVKSIVAINRGSRDTSSFSVCSGSLDGEIKVWDIALETYEQKI